MIGLNYDQKQELILFIADGKNHYARKQELTLLIADGKNHHDWKQELTLLIADGKNQINSFVDVKQEIGLL